MSNKNNIDWIKSIPSNPLFGGADLINNNFNCYIGSVLAFYLGQGRVTNLYGSETKIVCDWVYMLTEIPLLGIFPMAYRPPGTGGDSTFVLGPTNKLNYFGNDFAVNRHRHEIICTYKGWKKTDTTSPVPLVIWLIIILGFVGILATVLALRARYKMVSVSTSQTGMLASFLIPWFEGLWMGLLVNVECCYAILTVVEDKTKSALRKIGILESSLGNSGEQATNEIVVAADLGLLASLVASSDSLTRLSNEVGDDGEYILDNLRQTEDEFLELIDVFDPE